MIIEIVNPVAPLLQSSVVHNEHCLPSAVETDWQVASRLPLYSTHPLLTVSETILLSIKIII